jgi:hypothetical protein
MLLGVSRFDCFMECCFIVDHGVGCIASLIAIALSDR